MEKITLIWSSLQKLTAAGWQKKKAIVHETGGRLTVIIIHTNIRIQKIEWKILWRGIPSGH